MPRDTADNLAQVLAVGEAYQHGERALIEVLCKLNDANAKLAKVRERCDTVPGSWDAFSLAWQIRRILDGDA